MTLEHQHKTCETCAFGTFPDKDGKGRCHRYPRVYNSSSDTYQFPRVWNTDWCGEFKEKEDKL